MPKLADPNDIIYRENPDKRGLATATCPSEGRTVSRRSSRDETERRAAREKVRERVRRANELEEKKERELIEEERLKKRGKSKGTKSRGFLCGLFGKA